MNCGGSEPAGIRPLPRRALPAIGKDTEILESEALVDRGGLWRIHFVQPSSGVKRIGLADMEQLLYQVSLSSLVVVIVLTFFVCVVDGEACFAMVTTVVFFVGSGS